MRRLSVSCWRGAALLSLLAIGAAAGEVEWQVPEKLQQWKDAAYTKRFFLEVRPAEAAGARTLAEPDTA